LFLKKIIIIISHKLKAQFNHFVHVILGVRTGPTPITSHKLKAQEIISFF